MKRHRQVALVSIVQDEEVTLESMMSLIKPDCIVLIACKPEKDDNDSWMTQSLQSKINQACSRLGLENTSVITIKGPSTLETIVTASQFFNGLFSLLTGKGFDLVLDLTQVEKKWIIPLYNVALQHRPCVTSILMADDDELTTFWIYQTLTTAERTILEYLFEIHPIPMTPSEITEKYLEEHGQGQGSFISKILRNLNEMGLIQENKEGRNKFISLSGYGLSLFCPEDTKAIIQKQLSLPMLQDPFSSIITTMIQERMKEHNVPSLEEWLSFIHSTYFRFSDFQEAKHLGFNENEGLAFYLHQILAEFTASGHAPTLAEIDKKLVTKIRHLATQSKARNDVIYHPTYSKYLNEEEVRRLQLLEHILTHNSRIKAP